MTTRRRATFVYPRMSWAAMSWSPGFLDTPDASRLPLGALAAGANALLSGLGADGSCSIKKRTGAQLINATCIVADTRIDELFEFRREGVTDGALLAICNGSVYQWDGTSTFNLIGAGGLTPGAAIGTMTFRNLAFLMDGIVMKAWDGTTLFTPGLAAPTATGALTAVAPAGAGLTGTYQDLAVWYDSVHDHESSPTVGGTAVALVAQDRQHAKPTGAVPANADKWRVYTRRTDTNEVIYKLTVEAVVATATVTEAMLDSTRNLGSTLLAPLPNQNDVPPAFAFMATAQGYAMGVQKNDSYVWVSALGDPQSFHPKDKIPVSRGDGQNLTTLKAVGKIIVAQKGRRSYILTGDRMPFVPDDLSPSFGNHSQTSSVEAGGRYYAWDNEKGPYVTDLASEWTSLAQGRIANVVSTVNRGAEIRCAHVKEMSLICWLVSVDVSARTRVLLAYNYLVGAWLPPIYGIEYASLTTFQTTAGLVNLYIGDQWGRVYKYFTGGIEGVPGGTVTAVVTAATSSTVTAGGATFYTTGHGLKGMPVALKSPSGTWQFRTIQSNTATQITIDTLNGVAWTVTPAAGWTVYVGAIDFFGVTPLIDCGAPALKKRGCFIWAQLHTAATAGALSVRGRYNDDQAAYNSSNSLHTGLVGGTWGTGLWGTMLWGGGGRRVSKQRLGRSFFSAQFEFSNRVPNESIELVTLGVGANPLAVWP